MNNLAKKVIIFLLALTMSSCRAEIKEPEVDDTLAKGKVTYVYDGDTYCIKMEEQEYKVRLIGIDTPESVHQDSSKNTEEGRIASEYAKELLTNQDVLLEYDVQKEDGYGRILAYVYYLSDDNWVMVQQTLLEKGYAQLMTVQPNSKYADYFYQLQQTARENKVGFWNGFYQ